VRTGSRADLDAAITAGRSAATAMQPGHPDTAMHLSNLGLILRLSFGRTQELRYLEESIDATRQAVAVTTDGHPRRPLFLANLGVALQARYLATDNPADLDDAIAVSWQAVEAAQYDHPDQAHCRFQLGTALLARFDRSGDFADLDYATTAVRAAAAATEGPVQAEYLMFLGTIHETRIKRTRSGDDVQEAINWYTQAARADTTSPVFRIWAAHAGARLAGQVVPQLSADLLEGAVRLLPLTVPHQLTRADQQHALSQFGSLASDAAALALEAGGQHAASRALGLLELGRAVLQGQALDLRGDLIELHIAHPALAGRFLKLRDQLDTPDDLNLEAALVRPDTAMVTGPARATPDRRGAAVEFAALLEEIRGLEGFGSFLLPPEPGQLTRQARGGPIAVFNVSRYRSDALIVTTQAISQVPLPDLDLRTLTGKIDAFNDALGAALDAHASSAQRAQAEDVLSQILEWLWDAAAGPVLHHLGYVQAHQPGSRWPRVWWTPGGLLGQLPLHAAGYHRRAGAGETVMDRVTSSYTPTVRALAWARDHAASGPPRRALVVAMPMTPGQNALPYVAVETEMLRARLPSPTVLTEEPGPVNERTPTREAVIACLSDAAIVHFSCHAASHPSDPSQSQIFLHDHLENPFTVATLIPVRLPNAQLAYLSACQTARNTVADLLDEGIHLASAFQLAGYPHVIGTLWTINDYVAAAVADAFYRNLQTGPQTFDTETTAHALHHAVRELRGRRNLAATPSRWAAYTHTGA
jgi:hypothetical protein